MGSVLLQFRASPVHHQNSGRLAEAKTVYPVNAEEQQKVSEFSASLPEAQLDELKTRYEKQNYQALRNALVHPRESGITNPDVQKLVEAIYLGKAQKRYHIHHFVFGIPLMFVSWGLFVYGEGVWGLIIAGIVAALFLSELKELINTAVATMIYWNQTNSDHLFTSEGLSISL